MWLRFTSVEIADEFVQAKPAEEGETFSYESLVTVGQRAGYQGAGPAFGLSMGLRFASLELGLYLSWGVPDVDGYFKRYRYDPAKLTARGKRVHDSGEVHVQRTMFEMAYGLPLGALTIRFLTRFGAVSIDDRGLFIGGIAGNRKGLCMDIGLGFKLSLVRWLALGIQGYGGFYAFPGAFDGAYGATGGLSGTLFFGV